MNDYFDFSIYIDAENKQIEEWYLQRFNSLLQLAEADPSNYYHKFTQIPPHKAMELAKDIWKTINLVNLEKYIEPTRNRADFIIHKGKHHKIDEIYLKK